MPLYEYLCRCGNKFEEVRSIPERHSAVCTCGSVPVMQLTSHGMFRTAHLDRVVDCKGNTVKQTQSTEQTELKYRNKAGAIVNA